MSNGIDEPVEIRMPLAICLLIAWTAVFCCLYKGIKSSGEVNVCKADHTTITFLLPRGFLNTFSIKSYVSFPFQLDKLSLHLTCTFPRQSIFAKNFLPKSFVKYLVLNMNLLAKYMVSLRLVFNI